MTRKTAISQVAPNLSYFNDCKPEFAIKECKLWINKIYDDFEQDLAIAVSDKTCSGCKYEEEIREECALCSRRHNWFPDNYEEKKC